MVRVCRQFCYALYSVFLDLTCTSSGDTTRKYMWGFVWIFFSFLSPHLHPHPDEQKLKWKYISRVLFQVSRQNKNISIEEKKRKSYFLPDQSAATVVICQPLRNERCSLVGVSRKRLLRYCCWLSFCPSIACPSKSLSGLLRVVVSWWCTPNTTQKNVALNNRVFPKPQRSLPFEVTISHHHLMRWVCVILVF